uniref:Uncharacterized protein n=1 Tax=Ananas comosus var. bracteatus TaxID=296719 RepID=A0A6V7QDH5_ANACO|nr:unnamed protein product [Ananas comosus var. bracteatus]
MKPQLYLVVLCAITLFIIYGMPNSQYQEAELEARLHPFDTIKDADPVNKIGYLPHGIMQSNSDMELKPLWVTKGPNLEETVQCHQNLLAISVGIKQKKTVDSIIRKFLPDNFTAILFHYDGDVNGWHNLPWSKRVVHIAALNQTKWWFAKRFLHPDVVSIYDYIFLWDEDLGVDNFHPARYIEIVKSEGLEISQPALDPYLSEIHHRITVRRKKGKVHRRVYDNRAGGDCSSTSDKPPCAGWVEGMAPVFSRSAWRCAWNLIQNDLIHGWGIDMKLGYCAQGDRTKKVGVVDDEYIVHQGIQTLGGPSTKMNEKGIRQPVVRSKRMLRKGVIQNRGRPRTSDARIEVRRQARVELQNFQERWNRAVREDESWIDPFHPNPTTRAQNDANEFGPVLSLD